MCGRYALHAHPDVVALQFGLAAAPQLKPRFNIAPTQQAPVIRMNREEMREIAALRWGLIPSWAKDPAIGARMINARAETVAEKPAFRSAFRRQRCLVPADGYYEWKVEAGHKQPYLLYFESGEPFAMAGLWEHCCNPEGEVTETFAILTRDATGTARRIHERMPVILGHDEYETWLSGSEPVALLSRKWAGPDLAARRASTRVNSPRNDDERCSEESPAPPFADG
jgi:putative SOS response-associated peptidase YedK